MYNAIDEAVESLEQQIRKYKTKLQQLLFLLVLTMHRKFINF